MRHLTAISLVVLALAIQPTPSSAECDPDSLTYGPGHDTPLASSTVAAATALSPVGPHPILGQTAVAAGTTVYFRDAETLGALHDEYVVGSVESSPAPVTMNDPNGDYGVFITTTTTGEVIRLDPENSVTPIKWTQSIQRAGCTGSSGDSISGAPVVHLPTYATPTFQAAFPYGLVYVATRYGCSTHTANRVYAFNAYDGTLEWVFNYGASVDMDAALSSPFLDIENDRLIVATDRMNPTGQDTLFSINVLNGSKAWSVDLGYLWSAPVQRGDRIYVANLSGTVYALDASDGSELWSFATGVPISTDLVAEFRAPYDDMIGVVDMLGTIWMIRDDDTTGTEVWSTDLSSESTSVAGRVVLDPYNSKLYAGATDGRLYQLSMTDGTIEVSRDVDLGATVGAPTLFFDSGLANIHLAVGTDSGIVENFCAPWSTPTPPPVAPWSAAAAPMAAAGTTELCTTDAQCAPKVENVCATPKCKKGVCVQVPVPDGDPCEDFYPSGGTNENTYDECNAGTCSSRSECQQRAYFGDCECKDSLGGYVQRKLATTVPSSCASVPGQDLEPDWCRNTVVEFKAQNACLPIGVPDAFGVLWFHAYDEWGLPVTGAKVTMKLGSSAGSPPIFQSPFEIYDPGVDPLTEVVATESGRPGTYYTYIMAPLTGDPTGQSEGWPIEVQIAGQGFGDCSGLDTTGIMTYVNVWNGGRQAQGGCPLNSNKDYTGFLRIKVERAGSPGEFVPNAPVLLGYREGDTSKYLYIDYDNFVSGGPPQGTHFGKTDALGYITFYDYGNQLSSSLDAHSDPYLLEQGAQNGLRIVVGDTGQDIGQGVVRYVTDTDAVVTIP